MLFPPLLNDLVDSLHGIKQKKPSPPTLPPFITTHMYNLSFTGFRHRLGALMCQHLGLSTTVPERKWDTAATTLMLDVLEPTREVGNTAQAKATAAQQGSKTIPR